MTWKNDGHGLVTKSSEIKGYVPGHSWAMKLSQLAAQPGRMVRISTYSLNAEYAAEVLGRRPTNVCVLCSDKFRDEAAKLQKLLPTIKVYVVSNLHAKMVLIEPDTVYVGSMNFVRPLLKDCVVGIRGAALHDHYARLFDSWRTVNISAAQKYLEGMRAETKRVEEVLAGLFELYPDVFTPMRPRPLKIGIYRDLIAEPEQIDSDEDDLSEALYTYTSSIAYLKAMKCGEARINLCGEEDGCVTIADEEYALKCLGGLR